jgi:hypothetical protein
MAFNYSPKVITDGLVLYLDAANQYSYVSGSTSWNDISRGGNNGTLINGPTFNSANGGSIVFDGTNDYVNLSNTTSFNSTQPHTYSAWIYQTGFALYNWIIDNGGSNTGTSLITNSAKVGFFFNGGNSFVTSTSSISSNTWVNISTVYSSLNVSFYINGVFNSNSSIGSFPSSSTSTVIGRWNPASDFYFPGRIAQTQIYNRALSATEVRQNYNATKTRFGLT